MRFDDRRKYRPEQIEIEHNEPLLLTRTSKSRWFSLLASLEVGDSFFIPALTFKDVEAARATIYDAVRRSMLPIRVVTRKVEEGLRVWRVADDFAESAYITGDVEELQRRREAKEK